MLLNVGLYCPYCASKMQVSSKHQRVAVARLVLVKARSYVATSNTTVNEVKLLSKVVFTWCDSSNKFISGWVA